MVDMKWVRKTHADLIDGMLEHAAELETANTRHLYGAAVNRINLLMEHITELEAENAKLREALRDATDSFEEYSAYAGEYLRKKHRVEEEIAGYRALLEDE